mmetsp:Transcript_13527/g.36518  ORF Transcript_13527/g.36518 Transcript_13527/m.36518 type:complete len:648 (-) Transcript_13527:15-1958(-)
MPPPRGLIVELRSLPTGDHVPEDVILGEYNIAGTNHGRCTYKKLGVEENQSVLMYYWDDRDGPHLEGWWFGRCVGSDEVWAHNPSKMYQPPQVGWRVVGQDDSDDTLLVRDAATVETQGNSEPVDDDYEHRLAEGGDLANGGEPRGGKDAAEFDFGEPREQSLDDVSPPDLPWPWEEIRDEHGVFYWNPETEESVWDPPQPHRNGSLPREDCISPDSERDHFGRECCHSDPPPPWEVIPHDEGGVYYWNPETAESTWDFPTGYVEDVKPPSVHRSREQRIPSASTVPFSAKRSSRSCSVAALRQRVSAGAQRQPSSYVHRPRRERVVESNTERHWTSAGQRSQSRWQRRQRRPPELPRRRVRRQSRSRSRLRDRRPLPPSRELSRSLSRGRERRPQPPMRSRSWSVRRRRLDRPARLTAAPRSPHRDARVRATPRPPPPRSKLELVPRKHGAVVQSGPPLRLGQLELNFRGQRLGDEKAIQWCKIDGLTKLQSMPSGHLECVDFSQNDLTDVGLEAIVRCIRDSNRQVKRLMFFKNKLRNPTALCKLMRDRDIGIAKASGPKELHLSDNNLSEAIIEDMLECIAEHRTRSGTPIRPPFWIRAERNGLHSCGERLVKLFGDRGLDICLVTRSNRSKATRFVDVHLYVE